MSPLQTPDERVQVSVENIGGINGTSPDVRSALRDGEDETTDTDPQGQESITDQLVEDSNSDTVVCWTCGSDVEPQQIENMLDRLRRLRQEKLDERNTLQTEIDDLQTDKHDLET